MLRGKQPICLSTHYQCCSIQTARCICLPFTHNSEKNMYYISRCYQDGELFISKNICAKPKNPCTASFLLLQLNIIDYNILHCNCRGVHQQAAHQKPYCEMRQHSHSQRYNIQRNVLLTNHILSKSSFHQAFNQRNVPSFTSQSCFIFKLYTLLPKNSVNQITVFKGLYALTVVASLAPSARGQSR